MTIKFLSTLVAGAEKGDSGVLQAGTVSERENQRMSMRGTDSELKSETVSETVSETMGVAGRSAGQL